ncbi:MULTISPECIES: UvrB/UvrC motif-containing protein [unclassified Oscillibacter]|uniref:UvrB/UvrC motif-containing protein n=1 Tax=unclassified Oscillibacter TaxID=2629304 RepID=UPI0025F2B9B5|nr:MULTISPECIES: UvrB/UvrC motif-containing protein [unclassified Oscillibacter]
MKCEHCGKNEINFVYESNVNGHVEKAHLCSECAEKLGYTQAVAAHNRRMMQDFFGGGLLNSFFSPQTSLLGPSLFGEDIFDDFFRQMPALGAAPAQQQEVREKPLVEEKEQAYFAKMRQLNALRLEQRAAVLREDFEKAAQIRDQIHELDQEKPQQQAPAKDQAPPKAE